MNRLVTRIVLRNDSTANWLADKDQVLLKGEVGIEFLANGKVKMKIGNGTSTWEQLPYFGGDECRVTEVEVAKGANHIAAITTAVADVTLNKGDIAIVKEAIISADKLTSGVTQQYQYTAYVYGETSSGAAWKAMDGNYSAENVYFDEDLTYTANIGVLSLGSDKSKTLSAAGKSLETVMKSILAKTEYSSKTDPSYKIDTATATYSDLEVGNYITKLNWTTTFTDGTYSQGTVDSNKANYTTSTKAGCVPTYAISNSKDSQTSASEDSSFTLAANSLQIDSTSSKTYATITAKCTYAAPTRLPATNLGDFDSTCTQITENTTGITKTKNIDLTGYRSMFYKCFTGTPESLSTDYVRTNFERKKQVGNQIDGKDSFSFSVPEGTKEIVICLHSSKKISSATDEDNKQTVEFKNNFVVDNSTVDIEGANDFTTATYNVYRYVAASPLKANTYYIKIGS